MDIFNITISHFFKMESLNFIKASTPYVNIYNCEPANSPNKEYCYSIRSVFLVSVKFDFFSEKKTGIFIMSINSRSRLSASATYWLYGFGQEF